jgi:hypothetical protein
MDNFWVASYQQPFALWHVTIPFDIDNGLQFAKEYEQLAEKTQIAQITFADGTQTFKQATGLSYADYLAECIDKENVFPFMIRSAHKQRGWYTSHIQYYRDNGLIQADVYNLGEILTNLIPDATHQQQYRHMRPVPPIRLLGHGYELKKKQKAKDLHFSILVDSDIWFPYVVNWMDVGKNDRKWENNLELAQYHTPRLNQFINGIRKLTLRFRGSIFCEKDGMLFYYRKIVGNKGINLNVPPPEDS